ncbi:Nuclear receptor coregulator SMRT/SMRTER [Handroanthus impetiginosus]|uniref:Nuclear receptor coregulator SMRT/SMRTER n=1 Tax=Handroanthus impetiginosus TaxID=429701 RepID=A0A2G9H3B7_9LAMI|nr:Nuclear receptor coregulator SMRT/SMRTER [Handroanthus impetiginosus]
MPPEPLPWDRRDFRKHERSGSDPRLGGGFGGGGPHRWREQQHHHPHAPPPHPPPYHHQQQQRWYSDFRSSRPLAPGHGKQGGWHTYPDDGGNGFIPFGSRNGDRNFEDENWRLFGSRSDGRYFRNSRENRPFTQKEWKNPSWERAASLSGPGKPMSEVNNVRSTENTQTCHNSSSSKSSETSRPTSNSVSLADQSQPQSSVKEKNDKNGDPADGPTSTGQKSEKENCLGSIDWEPLKWTRSGSLSSRGSGFSHSSSSKSMPVDSIETVEVQPKNATPVQSPPADAAALVVSTAPAQLDETSSRKKPRLGWGEGLAKYEKKKVEGPEDGATKNELVLSVSNAETLQSNAANLLEKSPRVASLSDCASPATPSSVACSSSPGIEEKESIKEANVGHDATNSSCSPSIMSQTLYDGPPLDLENLELASIANLSSSIDELLQSDDPSSMETHYARTTSINKLLLWKVDMSKALEMTESEIDSLETELKSLTAEPRLAHPADSSSLTAECQLKPCEEVVTASKSASRPAPLQIVSSGETIVEDSPIAQPDEQVVSKDEDIDSPGSATSKYVEVLSAKEDLFPSETAVYLEGPMNLDVSSSSNLDETCPKNGLNDKTNSGCLDNHVVTRATNCEDFASLTSSHCDVDSIYKSILSSNKDSAKRALEELNKLLPAEQCPFDTSTVSSVYSSEVDSSVVKEKFLMRKRYLQFKEKVLTIKFNVFQHFWKEGRLVSLRKLRGKAQKKFDPGRNGFKKNRFSSRSRISYAGGPQTVPADEVIEFVNGLLSESAFKPYRSTLKMPALILDKDTKMSRFISNNGLVEDPCVIEKERSMINPWTPEEREIFIDKLATFGKDFSKIASFLDHKTTADCIEFYYKNHKSDSFEKTRKNPDFMKQRKSQTTTYLVTSGKRRNRESNAAALDILGAASEIVANVNDGVENQKKCTSRCFVGASSSYRARGDDGPLQRLNSMDLYSNERETVAADVLAGICVSLSSEAMSSCITSSVDPGEGYQDWRCQKIGSSMKRPLTPEVTQNVDDECSDESCGELDPTDWTDEEKSFFIQAVTSYGKDFKMISQCVRTKSMDQCKVFFSKARKCLGLDLIQPGPGTVSPDVNGGDSDIEDGCAVESGSVICNNGSECKMDGDLTPLDKKLNYESDIVGASNFTPDSKISEANNGLGPFAPMDAEPVSNNSSRDDSEVDEKPVTGYHADIRKQNGADDSFASVKEHGTMVLSSNMNSEQGAEKEDDISLKDGQSEAEKMTSVEASDGHCGEENIRQEFLLPDENLKAVEDRDANSSEGSDISSAVSEMKSEPQLAGNLPHPSIEAHSSLQIDTEKSCMSSVKQNGHSVSMKSSMLFSVPIKYYNNPNHNALLDVGASGISDGHSPTVVKTVDCQQHLSGHPLSDSKEPSQILRGYPVSVHTRKEVNGDANCERFVAHQNVLKRDENLHSNQPREFFLEKCNGSRQQSRVIESPCPPSREQSRDHPRPLSGCSSSVDKPSRNGDVKLFGKILVSSQQKPDSSTQRDDHNTQDREASCQSLNLKLGPDQKVNIDCNNYVGSEKMPVRSFGFWDGGRIQTGYPPLPDSALLLSKYPAAFSAGKLEQPPLHGVIKSNNGLVDYPVWRNRELQPFPLDMKQQQDALFTEMQRRNGGYDVASGLQHQAQGMLGINIVGRGGVCSGVSDPVAAIKMHYAKAEQLNVQGANCIRDDDRWRSNGDVGR